MNDPSITAAPEPTDDRAAEMERVLTGHDAIDRALERLDRLDDLDISSHPEEFDAIHGVLRESLAHAGRDGIDLDSP